MQISTQYKDRRNNDIIIVIVTIIYIPYTSIIKSTIVIILFGHVIRSICECHSDTSNVGSCASCTENNRMKPHAEQTIVLKIVGKLLYSYEKNVSYKVHIRFWKKHLPKESVFLTHREQSTLNQCDVGFLPPCWVSCWQTESEQVRHHNFV